MSRIATALLVAIALGAPAAASPQAEERPRPAFELPRLRERGTVQPRESAAAWCVVASDGSVSKLEGGALPTEDAGVIAAWTEPLVAAPRGELPLLALADGQRIVGQMAEAEGSPAWVSPWCAARPLGAALDGVASIEFTAAAAPRATEQDIVVLRNGDRIDGIVESIGTKEVTVERGGSDPQGRLTVDLATVASISLVVQPSAPTGARVWLRDGSVVDGPRVHWMGDDFLQLPGVAGAKTMTLTVPRRMVAGYRSAPGSIVPLATALPTASAPPQGVPMRVGSPSADALPGSWPLDLSPVEVEGPVVLSCSAPSAPGMLRMTVFRNATVRGSGSPDLAIRQAGKELLRRSLGEQDERVEVTVPVDAGAPIELSLSRADGMLAGTFMVLERAMLVPR